MIRVRLVGHIKTSVGSEEVVVNENSIDTVSLVKYLRAISRESNPGFNEFNTIVLVEGEGASLASKKRIIRNGSTATLIPFSHGG